MERAGLAKSAAGSKAFLAGCPTARSREELVRLVSATGQPAGQSRWLASVRPQGTLPRAGVVWDYRLDLPGGGTEGGVFRSDHTYSVASVVVEACTDLALPDWSPVGTNTLVEGWSYFSDPEWTNYANRFYRLRSP
jgi:hypothetical protein